MVGKTLGHYEILEPLGKGGMGEVYRARDTKLKRDVAIKVLPEELAADDARLARLEREAHLLASLNHPNVAAIYNLEESDGVRWFRANYTRPRTRLSAHPEFTFPDLQLLRTIMSNNVTAAGGNPDLAAKCYPSGTKNEATAMCLCGGVEIRLKTHSPTLTAFCHCQACRRAHSAPMYQMIYVATADICSKTGQHKEGEFELTITKGFELLKPAAPGPGNPNYESMDDNPNFGGIGRLFCSECGVIMMNALFARPGTEFNDGDEDEDMFCVFPATFTDKMNEFIQSWQPTHHANCSGAILPLAAINDGLEKWAEWPDGERWIG